MLFTFPRLDQEERCRTRSINGKARYTRIDATKPLLTSVCISPMGTQRADPLHNRHEPTKNLANVLLYLSGEICSSRRQTKWSLNSPDKAIYILLRRQGQPEFGQNRAADRFYKRARSSDGVFRVIASVCQGSRDFCLHSIKI